jgi:TPR repeat protein
MNIFALLFRTILLVSFVLSVACPQMTWARTHVTTKADIEELEKAHAAIKDGQYIECYNGVCHVADRGHPQAQQLLGQIYEKGIGVKKDAPKAVLYYEKAAKQGVGEAQARLGVILRNGEGVSKNPKRAQMWLKKAAHQNIGEAQYHLGQMYLHGEVSTPNLLAANLWLRRAAANGVVKAKEAIENLPEVGAVTQPSKTGIAYQQGMGNIEQSWQGYADMAKVLREVDEKAAAGI